MCFSLPVLAAGGAGELLIPPVDALIERHFEAPASAYGPGHRGIDYGAPVGTRVRAAGTGRVSWAGPVAGRLAVTIDHGAGLETTYSILSRLEVMRGDVVDEGHWIGSVGRSHDGEAGGLHFGVKLHDRYVDPLDYLGPTDLGDAIHLAPLIESEAELPEELHMANEGAGSSDRACHDPAPVDRPPPPNDNIAVAVAGLSSSTIGGTNAALLEPANGPASLGYPARRVYRFSYKGVRGPRFHQDYGAPHTWRDIDESAHLLKRLLLRIGRAHPGDEVDLFAHSQGGLVARAVLARLARSFDPRFPRVEHLVTYGTPHGGTTLAEIPYELEHETITGRFVLDDLSRRARAGRFSIDPHATSVEQMRPGSAFIESLAREDVAFGTRVLTLATPHDVIVPARSASLDGEDGRVLSPAGINGHREVVESDQGRSIAYAFLRDAAASCPGAWDEWGPLLSRGISFAHGLVADAYAELETAGLVRAYKALRWVAGKSRGVLGWAKDRAWDVASWTADRARSASRGLAGAGRLLKNGLARLWR